MFLEALEGVVLIHRSVEGLVPHRVGHDHVELPEAPLRVLELGVHDRVAPHDLGVHVVDHRVHPGDGVRRALEFLAEELERLGHPQLALAQGELALDQQAGRAAGVIVNRLALPRPHQVRPDAHGGRSEDTTGPYVQYRVDSEYDRAPSGIQAA